MSTKRKLPLSTPKHAKKVRKVIDLNTKMMVIRQHEGGKKVNVIACDLKLSHATTVLTKGSAPVQSTTITKQRTGPVYEMETMLYIWMEDQIQKRTPLSLFTVQTEVRSLFQSLKERTGDDCSQEFVASTGWFKRFKKKIPIS